MPGLPNGWFTQVTKQGDSLKSLISPSERYFAFLSKVDAVPGSAATLYNIMFEVQTYEWTAAAILSRKVSIEVKPQMTPASIFFIDEVAEATILPALTLSSADMLAEGCWFQFSLTKGEGDVTGYFHDADIDLAEKGFFDLGPVEAGKDPPPDQGGFFGRYHLSKARLISVPGWDQRQGLRNDIAPPGESQADAATYGPVRKRLAERYRTSASPMPITDVASASRPPAAAPPTVLSIAVMDVGAGNCTLLIDQNREPILYFDIGFPLYFHHDSAPPNIRPGAAGPIRAARGVILSHWDWDHWRLGCIHVMDAVAWWAPRQPVGGSARNWQNHLGHRLQALNPAAPHTVIDGVMVYQCHPRDDAVGAELMNNSGIALEVEMQLPSTGPARFVRLTGDASLRSVPYYFRPVSGLLAVHHGSDNHHASDDLPDPDPRVRPNGRVVYSYGIRANGRHVNGHPRAAAIAHYTAAGWTAAISTAEGIHINFNPPAIGARGNILIGDAAGFNAGAAYFPAALPACQNTAFSTFRYNRD